MRLAKLLALASLPNFKNSQSSINLAFNPVNFLFCFKVTAVCDINRLGNRQNGDFRCEDCLSASRDDMVFKQKSCFNGRQVRVPQRENHHLACAKAPLSEIERLQMRIWLRPPG
jgi:hypothetical protein